MSKQERVNIHELSSREVAELVIVKALNKKRKKEEGEIYLFRENNDGQYVGIPGSLNDPGRVISLPERFGAAGIQGRPDAAAEVRDLFKVKYEEGVVHQVSKFHYRARYLIEIMPTSAGGIYYVEEKALDGRREVGKRVVLAVSPRDLKDTDVFFNYFNTVVLHKGRREAH